MGLGGKWGVGRDWVEEEEEEEGEEEEEEDGGEAVARRGMKSGGIPVFCQMRWLLLNSPKQTLTLSCASCR